MPETAVGNGRKIKVNEINEKSELSYADYQYNICKMIFLISYWRRHVDCFVTDCLGVKLYLYQRFILAVLNNK